MLNSDIYILIPVTGKIKEIAFNNSNKDTDVDKYVESLIYTSNYECDNRISKSIKRDNLGKFYISSYKNDNYEENDIEWLDGSIVYTHHENTRLGILQIILKNCKVDDSQIGDMISSNHVKIKFQEKSISLKVFYELLGFSICGKIRTINCNHIKYNKDKKYKYTLVGETSNSVNTPYHINEKYFENVGVNDYSKYNFYELYADEKAIIYLLNDYSNKYIENVKKEVMLLFICEIAVFQNASVSRINSQIIDELEVNSNISSRKSLKLQVEYGKTIIFWNNNVFNYHATQDLSNDIVDSFKTKDLMDEYKKNSKHLEQIANLKSSIVTKIEAKVLNILAFILSISQIFELIQNIKKMLQGKDYVISLASSTIILVIVLLIIVRYNLLRNKRK